MPEERYAYVIVGGGLAGASAVEGIRQLDHDGPILLLGSEKHMPYDRPPLSKKLWFGKKKVDEIFLKDKGFYDTNGVTLKLGARVALLDPAGHKVVVEGGGTYRYGKLLLATGGTPRRLAIPGGGLEGVCYFRTLDDYLRIRGEAAPGKSAVVIGGGFIGSEIAAALSINKVNVTMIFPSPYLCDRVFPDYLGLAMTRHYAAKGVRVMAGEKPVSLAMVGDKFVTLTAGGAKVESDILIAGIGIDPETGLAKGAGLDIENGVSVDEFLQTSSPDVYAAGDNAEFPYQALGRRMRVEHWDNALNQGRQAGRNMAGAREAYTYMPYFFSDLFEFGYEAVGEVSSALATFADWQEENVTGVIYYLADGRVRGVMMCNVWDKVEAARVLIRDSRVVSPDELRGAIK